MKKHVIGLITGLLSIMPVGLAHASCPNKEAWGASITIVIVDHIKTVSATCASCYICLNNEGYPKACGTDCVLSGTVAPTLAVYHKNPTTGQWELVYSSGSCQNYTTILC